MVLLVSTFNGTGSDCSGSDGNSNRVLTLANTEMTQQQGFLVYASGLALGLDSEYTVSHGTSSTTVTFLNPLWDDMTIAVNYYTAGVGADDFENGPLNDFGVTVTRTPVTVTKSNISGQKTYTEGSDESITVVFENPNQKFGLDKAGLTERFDARIFCRSTQTINKYDKITYDSKVYRVDTVSKRNFNGTLIFKTVNLFFVE